MSFRKNENQQLSFNDSTRLLGERELEFLRKSWAEEFAETVFPAINEERFAVLYSENPASRPNTPVNVIVGLLLLKEKFGLTDEELMEQLLFNVQFQYALRTTSFAQQPISDRTLSRFRARVYEYAMENDGRDLIQEEMLSLAAVFAKKMGVTSEKIRMDSMMVSANCRRLSRLGLMHLVVQEMAEKVNKSANIELPAEFNKYLRSSDSGDITYRLKKDETAAKMEEILDDAVRLSSFCAADFSESDEYRRLLRMLEEQSFEADGGRVLKDNSEISASSMQSPYDEDATFRKKGQSRHVGYVLNLQESCCENGNLVTNYDLQPNTYSDIQFAKDAINSLPEENDVEVIITDGAFGCAETLAMAEERGIELAATTLSGGVRDGFESEFEINEEKEITRCPAGHAPISSKYRAKSKTYQAHFDKETCENCPYRDRCPGVFRKKTASIYFTESARIRAEYFNKMTTKEYQNYANLRNGVESLPSALRRKYGIDHMPAKGLTRSKIWIGFKIGAMNFARLLKWKRSILFFGFSCVLRHKLLAYRFHCPRNRYRLHSRAGLSTV